MTLVWGHVIGREETKLIGFLTGEITHIGQRRTAGLEERGINSLPDILSLSYLVGQSSRNVLKQIPIGDLVFIKF